MVEGEGGHGPGALERAGSVDSKELETAPNVAVSPVGRRLGARIERPDDDRVAGTEPLDPRADLGDRPRHLVANDLRRPHPSVHRAMSDVQVGAADAAIRDVEPHLPGGRRLPNPGA